MALAAGVTRADYGDNIPLKPWAAAANQVFFEGSGIVVKSDGFAYVGVTGTGQKVPGVAAFALDTTGLADGAKDVIVKPGTLGDFENSAGADAIAAKDIGKRCYLVDDDTMALTDGTGTRSDSGMIFDVTAEARVIVQFELVRA